MAEATLIQTTDTKKRAVLSADITLPAGAGTIESDEVDVSKTRNTYVGLRVTNGGITPGTAASGRVWISLDGGTEWLPGPSFTFDTGANVISGASWNLFYPINKLKVIWNRPIGQPVTARAEVGIDLKY